MNSDYLLTSVEDGVRLIKFNRQKRKNAWNLQIYTQLIQILNDDAVNNNVIVTIFTGEGEYYSSGNDFSPEVGGSETYDEIVIKYTKVVENFIKTLIDYPKILIAVVNGPAIGFAVTTLALFDVVYASERSSFSTPFVNLRLCPEACSSYLFPRIMGRSKASEMLLLGKKITANEACSVGLVSKVVPHDQLTTLYKELRQYGKLPLNSVQISKKLINSNLKEILHKTNLRESETLCSRLLSEDFLEVLMNFSKHSKSKL